ncbi:zinc finger protein 622 [Chiloscyllium plagiosum]|uniref:zinc finger protein 622 n=1 Tax=Chiloscyllium plagiosum TaxID=36176 RepID=UPI001CB86E74|nr:zinc finger protein 622 [Chiloscyllium plagiosum]XP_043539539.1 zinc finger protein 622 [Chiloscyllium plagiosum]XP_043539540.1 zinc finger protein 622 [Chiloscyllium plagiosum]
MSSYTCITCHVAFGDAEIQRSHYKTDWHRYNLKRKVAEMPPVTAENFQERVLALRSAVEEKKKGTATDCTSCGKRFATFNAYENHLKSKKHQDAEKKFASIANKQLERLNVKNLEMGISEDGMDKDTVNIAIQQAVKAQLAPSTRKRTVVPVTEDALSQVTVSSEQNKKPDKPPRLLWFEQQAAKLDQLESFEEEVTMEDEDDGEWEDVDSVCDEEEHFKNESRADKLTEDSPPGSIQITDCLFCSHHSRSLFKNIDHMTKMHGFFIPDIEYLVDLKGLMKYLGEKVGLGNVCLWCNEKGRSFYSTEAVQAHMVDSSHCKLFTDGDAALEFADFYDFRGSYPDHKHGEDIDMKAAEIPNKNLEYNEETMELVLPSGARIGHRSLLRYYKQHFGMSRTVATTGSNTLGRVLQQYKALGWSSELAKAASQRKERDMQYVQRMKSKWMLKTALSNNATKQMHFRPQILF